VNEVKKRDVNPGTLAGGMILIVLGVLFLLDRLRMADFGDVIGNYWPMILVTIGVIKMWRRETIWGGLWLVTIGVWLQLVTLHLFGLTYGNSWPLILIALGAGIIVRTVVEAASRSGEERHDG
jgi:hypothetical protein